MITAKEQGNPPVFKHDGAKAITINDHISNFSNKLLSLPLWQRKGQKIWQGDYRSELIDSIMSGVMLPIIYLAKINGSRLKSIIDGGHRTRTLAAYKNNEFAWEYKNELVYYSETHHVFADSLLYISSYLFFDLT